MDPTQKFGKEQDPSFTQGAAPDGDCLCDSLPMMPQRLMATLGGFSASAANPPMPSVRDSGMPRTPTFDGGVE